MIGGNAARELSEDTPFIGRVLRRWRPREGWLIAALAWLGVISLPAAAAEGRLLAGIEVAFLLSTLGLLFGWWGGHRRWRGLFFAPAGLLTGIAATLIWGVYVVSPLPLIWQAGRWLAWGITCGIQPACKLPAPALAAFGDQAVRLADFAQRVSWWVNGVVTGQGIPDNLVVVGFAALIAFGLAAWAGWWLAGLPGPLPHRFSPAPAGLQRRHRAGVAAGFPLCADPSARHRGPAPAGTGVGRDRRGLFGRT
jgi:hypothetical protein